METTASNVLLFMVSPSPKGSLAKKRFDASSKPRRGACNQLPRAIYRIVASGARNKAAGRAVGISRMDFDKPDNEIRIAKTPRHAFPAATI